MSVPREKWPPLRRALLVFHQLWTEAVGTPGYDKAKWKRLAELIDDLALLARRETTEWDLLQLREKGGPEK